MNFYTLLCYKIQQIAIWLLINGHYAFKIGHFIWEYFWFVLKAFSL